MNREYGQYAIYIALARTLTGIWHLQTDLTCVKVKCGIIVLSFAVMNVRKQRTKKPCLFW